MGSTEVGSVVAQPKAWLASDIKNSSDWVRPLLESERQALRSGLDKFLRLGRPVEESTGRDFDFGDLGTLLRDLDEQLSRGFGLVVLKGFPIEDLSEDEVKALYWGFTNHLGVLRPQGKNSALINHVRDAGGVYRAAGGRGYNTNVELDFHVDFSDLVGLLCIKDAKSGGTSKACSSMALFEHLKREAPDLASALMEPLYYSRQDEEAPDEPPFYMTPVVAFEEGRFSCRYTRNHIRYAARHEGAKAPSDRQEQAMEWMDAAAKTEKFTFDMRLTPGDLQLINNHVVLHSRTAYEDHEEPEKRRSLLRTWISTPNSQPLSPMMVQAFHDHRAGAVRGGIVGQLFDEKKQAYTRQAAEFHGMLRK